MRKLYLVFFLMMVASLTAHAALQPELHGGTPGVAARMPLSQDDDNGAMLANPLTGSTRFTNSNINDVAYFPAYINFTVYQITEDEAAAVDTPESWLPATPPPAQVAFATPAADTNVITTVWYTNLTAVVPLTNYTSAIYFTRVAPAAMAHATLTRHLVEGYSTVVLTAADVDAASSGGTANDIEMAIFDRIIKCTADTTPEAPYVTFSTAGVYEVTLQIINEAGNSAFATSTVTVAEGELRTWSGLGADNLASNSDNWSPAETPVSGNNIRFDDTGTGNCTWDLDIVVAAWEQTPGYTGTVTFRTLYPSQGSFTNLTVAHNATLSGGTWTHPANSGGAVEVNRLCLTVGGDFTLGATALIDLDGKGYASAQGPGAGNASSTTSGRSASHGGAGANNPAGAVTYGSAVYPESLGSGGYSRGGGAMKLKVGGVATIGGTIRARGVNSQNANYCHGSGGSVLIEADSFAGAGTINAGINTASITGYYGSGGGRIALHADADCDFSTLSISAYGDTAQNRNGYGRAGTVFLATPSARRLIVNQGNVGTASENFTYLPAQLPPSSKVSPAVNGELIGATLVITNGAFVKLTSDLRIDTIGWLKGTLALNAFLLYCNAAEPANFPASHGNGTIAPNGVYRVWDDGTTFILPGYIVWDNTTVFCRVAADSLPRNGGTNAIDGAAADAFYAPCALAEVLAKPVEGFSFVRWEGDVGAAEATSNPVEVGPLGGDIALRARFRDNSLGTTTNIWLSSTSNNDWFDPLNWSLVEVPQNGQVAVINAGADILLTNTTAQLDGFIMNGGTFTFVNWTTELKAAQVDILGGKMTAPVAVPNGTDTNRVNIVCQGFYLADGAQINVNGCGYGGGRDPAGGVNVFVNGKGPGKGTGYGSSGSYGGLGGLAVVSNDRAPAPGSIYDDPAAPLGPGSGGGTYDSRTGGYGGHGGGSVRIDAGLGHVTINGTVTANGGTFTVGGASGSGGAIWISCGTFASTNGSLSASSVNDAVNEVSRGGGGGGRIAIDYDRELQNGMPLPTAIFTVREGKSRNSKSGMLKIDGDIGTLYFTDTRWFTNGVISGHVGELHFASDIDAVEFNDLIVEDAWIRFSDALAEINIAGDLTVGEGGRLDIGGTDYHALTGIWELRNPRTHAISVNVGGSVDMVDGGYLRLVSAAGEVAQYEPGLEAHVSGVITVDSESRIRLISSVTNGASAFVSCGNLNVEAGGRIEAAGAGFAGQRGRNGKTYGPNAALGGGGHGGAGGKTAGGSGGTAHDDPLMPYNCGTGGGSTDNNSRIGTAGGYGGGRIRLSVANTALVNGTIDASGARARGGYGSAGAGGTIYIDCRRLRGNGLLVATGAKGIDGATESYGAGGGGRIAVWYGQPYEEGVTRPERLIINEDVPESGFAITANVNGGTGDNPGGVGSIRFVKVTANPVTVLLLR